MVKVWVTLAILCVIFWVGVIWAVAWWFNY